MGSRSRPSIDVELQDIGLAFAAPVSILLSFTKRRVQGRSPREVLSHTLLLDKQRIKIMRSLKIWLLMRRMKT